MKIKHFTILILALCFLLPAISFAQRIYETDLPAKLEDHAEWNELQKRKEALIADLRRQIDVELGQQLTANFEFYLELAFRELEDYGLTAFQDRIAKLIERRPVLAPMEGPLDKFGADMAPINERMEFLRELYRYAEDNMRKYRVDTILRSIQTELDFYALSDGDRIGEIGAGDETFAAVVASKNKNVAYYINEVGPDLLERIGYHLLYNPIFNTRGNAFYPILGSSTSTGLEGQGLDKIIIRNAVHHFARIDEMMLAVKASLAEDGLLLIKEMHREDCRNNCCEELFGASDLRQSLDKSGFIHVESAIFREYDGDWHLYKFKISAGH